MKKRFFLSVFLSIAIGAALGGWFFSLKEGQEVFFPLVFSQTSAGGDKNVPDENALFAGSENWPKSEYRKKDDLLIAVLFHRLNSDAPVSGSKTEFIDLNGDGLQDFIYMRDDNRYAVLLNKGGQKFEFSYKCKRDGENQKDPQGNPIVVYYWYGDCAYLD